MPVRPVLPILITLLAAGCADAAPTAVHGGGDPLAAVAWPQVIALPDGFWPEGIDFGRGSTFYVSSLATGAIYRGDARTGTGGLLTAGEPGTETVGLKYDPQGNRLFVAGGFTGHAFVYDAGSGAVLGAYPLAQPGDGLINDLAIVRDAVYFTDSFNPVLYRLPLGPGGELPAPDAVEVLPLTGDWVEDPTSEIGNANGIVATPGGRWLIVVNMATGTLYRVDPGSGNAMAIDLAGGSAFGDGMLLIGDRLYVVDGPVNEILEIRLSADFLSGTIVRVLTSAHLQFPSTIARFGNTLYAVNARFDVPPTVDTEYSVVAVPR